jgi:hypothetical protein
MNPPVEDESVQEYVMPCAEAMLAGTLALMTGYAQHGDAGVRSLMAKKVVSNLFFLSGHPHLSDHFKTMLGNLRSRWQLEVERGANPVATLTPSQPQSLWHPCPSAIQ